MSPLIQLFYVLHIDQWHIKRKTWINKVKKCRWFHTELEGSLNGLMRIKTMWLTCNGLHSEKMSSQLNPYGRFCCNMFDCTPHHHYQNTKWLKSTQQSISKGNERENLTEITEEDWIYGKAKEHQFTFVPLYLDKLYGTIRRYGKPCKEGCLKCNLNKLYGVSHL